MSILEEVNTINSQMRQERINRQYRWNHRNFMCVVVSVGAAILSALVAIIAVWKSI